MPGKLANRGWNSGAATCWPGGPGTPATRTGSSPRSKPARLYPARPIRRSRRGPRSCWPTRPSCLATWPNRTGTACSRSSSPGPRQARKGSSLALTAWTIPAIAGAGIQLATVAALDEAANVLSAHPDRFTETAMHRLRAWLFATLGQLDAAEAEVGLCWAAGRTGAVRLVEFLGPLAEARLAVARDDAATAVGALRRAADGGRRVAIVMFVPPLWLIWRAWPPSPVTNPRRQPPSARHARSSTAAARRSPPPRSATPRASWPGTAVSSPTPST